MCKISRFNVERVVVTIGRQYREDGAKLLEQASRHCLPAQLM
jgi:hypothetical protein